MLETPDRKSVTPRRSRLRTFNRIGCVVFVVLFTGLLVIGHFEAVREAEADLAALKKRLTAEGILVPIDRLIPKVPKGQQNAADLYERAFGSFQITKDEQQKLDQLPKGSPQRTKLMLTLVHRNQGYYDLVDQASKLKYCAFPFDWADPYGARPHHADLRDLARQLALRAEARMGVGDHDGAIESCLTGLRAAEHIKMEPAVISQLVAWAVQGIVLARLRDCISSGDPSPAECRRAFSELAAINQVSASVSSIRGEIVFQCMPLFESLARDMRGRAALSREPVFGVSTGIADEVIVRSYGTVGRNLLYEDERTMLQQLTEVHTALSMPWPEAIPHLNAAASLPESVPAYRSVVTRSGGIFGFMYFKFMVERDAKAALIRLSQVALAAKAFRYARKRYPLSLPELAAAGWDLPNDPFTGKPLRYRRDGNGFVVWSLGPNMADDGRVEYNPDTMSVTDGPYDIVFRVKR